MMREGSTSLNKAEGISQWLLMICKDDEDAEDNEEVSSMTFMLTQSDIYDSRNNTIKLNIRFLA